MGSRARKARLRHHNLEDRVDDIPILPKAGQTEFASEKKVIKLRDTGEYLPVEWGIGSLRTKRC